MVLEMHRENGSRPNGFLPVSMTTTIPTNRTRCGRPFSPTRRSGTGRPERSAQHESRVSKQLAEGRKPGLSGLRQLVANVHVCSHVAVSAQCVLALALRDFQMDARQ